MRLTCPSCAAVYAIADDALPPGGKHVQCSACHTRWFARAEAPPPAALSEDEILARLDTRARRPALAVVPTVPVPVEPQVQPAPVEPQVQPAPDGPVVPPPVAAAAILRSTPLRQLPLVEDGPAAMAGRGPLEAGPLRPRAGAEALRAPAVAPPRRRSRFGRGLVVGLLLGAACLGLYLAAAPLAERVPAIAPQAAALGAAGERLRLDIETRLGPLRDRVRAALADVLAGE